MLILTKKFLSVLLLIIIAFFSADSLKCFATDNETFYENCTRAFEKIKEVENQVNELKAVNAKLRMSTYISCGGAAVLLGVILGKPIWQCINLAAWELNTWENRLFKDVKLRHDLKAIKDDIDFLNVRVNGLAKKIGFPEIDYNDIAIKKTGVY